MYLFRLRYWKCRYFNQHSVLAGHQSYAVFGGGSKAAPGKQRKPVRMMAVRSGHRFEGRDALQTVPTGVLRFRVVLRLFFRLKNSSFQRHIYATIGEEYFNFYVQGFVVSVGKLKYPMVRGSRPCGRRRTSDHVLVHLRQS